MAEPYREPPVPRPRWVLTCWPRASAWPLLVALALSVPCVVLGWQGEPAADVLGCSPEVTLAMRCSVTRAEQPTVTRVEDCAELPKHLALFTPLTHQVELRQRYAPFVANDSNVFVNGSPVVVARRIEPPKAGEVAYHASPSDALQACAGGGGPGAIEVEIHRRNVWLVFVAPLLAALAALMWIASRRVRVVLEPGTRSVLATRLGLSKGVSALLEDTVHPGWIRVGDVEHEGSLDDAATRRRIARWFARRAI